MNNGFLLWYVINECKKSMEKDEKVMNNFIHKYYPSSSSYDGKKVMRNFYMKLIIFIFLTILHIVSGFINLTYFEEAMLTSGKYKSMVYPQVPRSPEDTDKQRWSDFYKKFKNEIWIDGAFPFYGLYTTWQTLYALEEGKKIKGDNN